MNATNADLEKELFGDSSDEEEEGEEGKEEEEEEQGGDDEVVVEEEKFHVEGEGGGIAKPGVAAGAKKRKRVVRGGDGARVEVGKGGGGEGGVREKRGADNEVDSEDDGEGEADDDDIAFIDAVDVENEEEQNVPWAGGDDDDDEGAPVIAPEAIEDFGKPASQFKMKEMAAMVEAKSAAEDLLGQMDIAAGRDIALYKNGEPPIHKLALCSAVVSACGNKRMHSTLMNGMILDRLKEWLEPMPAMSGHTKGAQVNSDVKKCVLESCLKLPIDTGDATTKQMMKSSKIGHAIMSILKGKKENKENRRLAHRAIDKWSRPIFRLEVPSRRMTMNTEERELRPREIDSGFTVPISDIASGKKKKKMKVPRRDVASNDIIDGNDDDDEEDIGLGKASLKGKGYGLGPGPGRRGMVSMKDLQPKRSGDDYRIHARVPQASNLDFRCVLMVTCVHVNLDTSARTHTRAHTHTHARARVHDTMRWDKSSTTMASKARMPKQFARTLLRMHTHAHETCFVCAIIVVSYLCVNVVVNSVRPSNRMDFTFSGEIKDRKASSFSAENRKGLSRKLQNLGKRGAASGSEGPSIEGRGLITSLD